MGTGVSGYYLYTKNARRTRNNWSHINTSIVWDHIQPTQEAYSGTCLPRSFNIDTSQGKLWTHGNATKHMHEAIKSVKDSPRLKYTDPKLYTQFILYDYWQSLNRAVISGVKYGKEIIVGNWEFSFAKPKAYGQNPVVKHAEFTGLK